MATIRLYAAARAAAGACELESSKTQLQQILDELAQASPELARIIPQCSVLIDGLICHGYSIQVGTSTQIDILPKFAGG